MYSGGRAVANSVIITVLAFLALETVRHPRALGTTHSTTTTYSPNVVIDPSNLRRRSQEKVRLLHHG